MVGGACSSNAGWVSTRAANRSAWAQTSSTSAPSPARPRVLRVTAILRMSGGGWCVGSGRGGREARVGVVVGVEVVGVVVEGGEVVGVGDGEEAGGDRLPAEFVQVEGDGVGGFQSGESVAVPVAEEEAPAVGGVDVEAGAVGGAAVGDLGERVDEAGVGGAGGGDDEVGAGDLGEGFVECGGVEGAGGCGDGDGFGQAGQPGGAGYGVVGVGAVEES